MVNIYIYGIYIYIWCVYIYIQIFTTHTLVTWCLPVKLDQYPDRGYGAAWNVDALELLHPRTGQPPVSSKT